MGVEPTSSAWKADVLAVVRHPHILWKIFLVPQAENIQNTQSLFFLFILDFSRFSSDTTIRFAGLLAYSCALFCHRYPVDVQPIGSGLTHQCCTSVASLICIGPERTTLTVAGSALSFRWYIPCRYRATIYDEYYPFSGRPIVAGSYHHPLGDSYWG